MSDAAVERVVLIGFMASGKSTVGRLLAERLRWRLVDFDAEIERRTGRSIPSIFRDEGEAAFRRLEAELTDELVAARHAVLAPGGGWPMAPGRLERFGEETLVVWLRITAEEAVARLRGDPVERPLLAGPDPVGRARDLLGTRESRYGMADLVIDVDRRAPEDVAAAIAGHVADRGGD